MDEAERITWKGRFATYPDERLMDVTAGGGECGRLADAELMHRRTAKRIVDAMSGFTIELGRRMFSKDPEERARGRAIAAKIIAERAFGDLVEVRSMSFDQMVAERKAEGATATG